METKKSPNRVRSKRLLSLPLSHCLDQVTNHAHKQTVWVTVSLCMIVCKLYVIGNMRRAKREIVSRRNGLMTRQTVSPYLTLFFPFPPSLWQCHSQCCCWNTPTVGQWSDCDGGDLLCDITWLWSPDKPYCPTLRWHCRWLTNWRTLLLFSYKKCNFTRPSLASVVWVFRAISLNWHTSHLVRLCLYVNWKCFHKSGFIELNFPLKSSQQFA